MKNAMNATPVSMTATVIDGQTPGVQLVDQLFRGLKVSVGDHDLVEVAGSRQVPDHLPAHRAGASQDERALAHQ